MVLNWKHTWWLFLYGSFSIAQKKPFVNLVYPPLVDKSNVVSIDNFAYMCYTGIIIYLTYIYGRKNQPASVHG